MENFLKTLLPIYTCIYTILFFHTHISWLTMESGSLNKATSSLKSK